MDESLTKEKRLAILMKKLSQTQRQQFINLVAELSMNAFSLQESIDFIIKVNYFPNSILLEFKKMLLEGYSLSKCFSFLGFPAQQVVQIQLAEQHGNLRATLLEISRQISLVETYKQQFKKVITYPVLLLIFLLGIFVSMRQILLPQLIASNMVTTNHWGVQFIQKFPVVCIVVSSIFFIFLNICRYVLRKQSSIDQANLISRLPMIGRLYRLYQSAYFALEWGKLFCEGIELKQIIQCMQKTDKQSLTFELAHELASQLKNGQPFIQQLNHYPFFTKELIQIIQQGEATGRLGHELLMYSQTSWDKVFEQIKKFLVWLQPILFLVIATLIIFVYASMLLPIYSNFGSEF